MNKKVVVIGSGGHAKVIADIIEKAGDTVQGFLDDNKNAGDKVIKDYPVLGPISECEKMQVNDKNLHFIIAIGNNYVRKKIHELYNNLNYYIAIHPTAIIGIEVEIGQGTVIMANTAINSSAKIGKHCIINTGAIVEHDNTVDDYVHISPNATLCGTVKVGECTHIGAGSIVKNNVKIEKNCIIGVGAVVIKNITETGTYVGVPVKKIKD